MLNIFGKTETQKIKALKVLSLPRMSNCMIWVFEWMDSSQQLFRPSGEKEDNKGMGNNMGNNIGNRVTNKICAQLRELNEVKQIKTKFNKVKQSKK